MLHLERERHYKLRRKSKCDYMPAAYNPLSKSPNAQSIQKAERNWWARIGYRLDRRRYRAQGSRFRTWQFQRVLAGLDRRGLSYHRYRRKTSWLFRVWLRNLKRKER